MRRFFTLVILWMVLVNPVSGKEMTALKIKITTDNGVLTATMLDNPTSRDFISMMPITVALRDYAGTEKVGDLPRKLFIQEAPQGHDPSPGDITLYAPWGNLAIFYKDFGYANGLVHLGKIDSGIDKLSNLNEEVTFEMLE